VTALVWSGTGKTASALSSAEAERFFSEEAVTVQYSRQDVVNMLRRTGFREAADEAMRELPDPVDLEYVQEWGSRHGITRDDLISRMGGSP
jgi:hypothetical protein